MKYSCVIASAAAILASTMNPATAGELGHYAPGLPNIRDLLVPAEPGFYYAQYHFLYTANAFHDRNGNEVDSINVGGATLNIDADVNAFAIAPTFLWVSPWEILGARYGAYAAPTLGNTSFQASLRTETGFGRSTDDSSFAPGDLFVQPVWLGWSGKHFDATVGYGFYAPVGKYEDGATDNVGLGFWTHQFQVAGAWYPVETRMLAVTFAGTFEIHSEKTDVDITPGERFSLNYGISQYIPLNKGPTWMGEIGVIGFSQWEVGKDSGSAVNPVTNVRDQVHAIGVQAGATYLPWEAGLTFHYLHEYDAEARFEGEYFGLTLVKAF